MRGHALMQNIRRGHYELGVDVREQGTRRAVRNLDLRGVGQKLWVGGVTGAASLGRAVHANATLPPRPTMFSR